MLFRSRLLCAHVFRRQDRASLARIKGQCAPPDGCGDLLIWSEAKTNRLRSQILLTAEERPVDPYGAITQAQAADLIIRPDMNLAEAQQAYGLDPWHPLVHLALAGFEEDPIRADFLRRYSLDRLPNDPRLCQRAAEFLRKQGKEDLAREVEAQGQ